MLLACGMRQVAAFRAVECQAKAALIGAQVIAHDVGVIAHVRTLKLQLA